MLCELIAVVKEMTTLKIRRYSELKRLKTFTERFEYLKLEGIVGESTFGYNRYLNQDLYNRDPRWKSARAAAIIRDNGCDLGDPDRKINDKIIVHHMNAITEEDILNGSELVYNPEFLICTSDRTHRAIHYSDASLLSKGPIVRKSGDTCPWK